MDSKVLFFVQLSLAFGLIVIPARALSSIASKMEETTIITVTADPIGEASEERSFLEVIPIDDSVEKDVGSVAEVLSAVSGMTVLTQGGVGKTASLFLRGTNPEHIVVLIDGVEMNDSMSPGRGFDFSRLNLDGIERIEILKGMKTVRYGANALGGVVNIVTKNGQGPLRAFLEVEGGSFYTQKSLLGISGGSGQQKYNVSISRFSTEGFSSANIKDGNTENDGHRQTDVTAKSTSTVTNEFEVTLTGKYIDAETDLDAGGGAGNDDPNFTETTTQKFVRMQATYMPAASRLESTAAINFSQTERKSTNRPDINDSSQLDESFSGVHSKLELVNEYIASEQAVFTFGADHKEERGDGTGFSEKEMQTTGTYLEQQGQWGSFFENTGIRHDISSQLNSGITTFFFSPGYKINSTLTTLKANYGKGLKLPSLFQLYDPTYGNPDLKPEEVSSWEFAIVQPLINNKIEIEASYYENAFDNLISLDSSTFRSVNLGKAKIRGIETGVGITFSESLLIDISQSHLFQGKSTNTNERLVRRPRNTWKSQLKYKTTSNTQAILSYRYVGSRDDYDANSFVRVHAPSYEVVNLVFEYNKPDNSRIFFKVENLFDREYEEVDGFGTPGFSLLVGARVNL